MHDVGVRVAHSRCVPFGQVGSASDSLSVDSLGVLEQAPATSIKGRSGTRKKRAFEETAAVNRRCIIF